MPAIWGIWRRDGNPSAARDLARMAGQLAAFGPDGRNEWTGSGVGLGRMLAMTVPEDSFDRQPIHLAGGSVMVADVRLDNRAELAEQLGIAPAQLGGMADSEVLAEAWARWQEGCLGRLAGSFAFAVWEEARRRLFCARDPLGRRPLYYFVQGPLFAFASLPRGLRGVPEVPWTADETMIAIRLAFLPHKNDRSFFEKIHRLGPAHSLSVTEAAEDARQYWKPDPERRIEFPRDEDYAEAFLEVFDEAVRCRLRARTPIGSLLSGGFDSGSVTASAAALLAREGQPLTAFTAVPAPEFDGVVPGDRFGNEAEHAASVAALYPNIRHVLVPPVAVCPLDLMDRPLPWTDSPGSHFSMAPYAMALGKAQREAGVGVVLTGLSGNTIISYHGLPLMAQLVRQGRWREWFREAQGLRAHARFGWPGVLAQSLGPWLPPWLWRTIERGRSASYSDVRKYVLLHPSYFHQGKIFKLAAELGWDLAYTPHADGREARLAGLLRFDHGAGSAAGLALNGVDYRDPTVDRRVVEFCLAAPPEQYLRHGRTKYLLRRAMAGRLPPRVLEEWRKGLLGGDWYLRVAPYRSRFAEAVEWIAESPAAQRCLDLERMRRLVTHWPQDWTTHEVRREYGMGLGRAVQAGAFLRWVEEGV
jgi:asparagine synthase (glutamine-hydrolysing)